MKITLIFLMCWMLLRSAAAMTAAGEACRLFVTGVLPGLFPYMTLGLMLVSRMSRRIKSSTLMLLGWCGGSPTGARLMRQSAITDPRLAVRCATMSPMFLAGTVGSWLNQPFAGWIVLLSVLAGGFLAGFAAKPGTSSATLTGEILSLGSAVESAAKTMLMVCGTMVMLRVIAVLVADALPAAFALPLTTMLEVTTGAQAIAELPLPLALRTALIAAATGFGGGAVILQNRALYPAGMLPLWQQIMLQALHGGISFLIALGAALLLV